MPTFCRLRGTTIGANNRLDVLKILTTGVNATELKNWTGSILELVEGWEEDETHDPDVPAVSHSRGLSPFVFVPFEEVCNFHLQLSVCYSHYGLWSDCYCRGLSPSVYDWLECVYCSGWYFGAKPPSGEDGLLCPWVSYSWRQLWWRMEMIDGPIAGSDDGGDDKRFHFLTDSCQSNM